MSSVFVAQRHIEHVVAKAAVCEAMVRAKIDYYKKQYDADGFIDQLNAKVISPCKAYANEDKLEFKSRFNKCYKYGIAAVPGGVFGFFKNAVTPVKNPIVAYEKHKDKGGAVYSFPDCE